MICGQKAYLYAGILNQKMALGSDVVNGLRIVTYNCRSVKSSIDSVKQLCRNNDIVMLQEHWLLPDDVGFLSCIDTDFVAFGSSAVNTQSNLLTGRPYGEVQLYSVVAH